MIPIPISLRLIINKLQQDAAVAKATPRKDVKSLHDFGTNVRLGIQSSAALPTSDDVMRMAEAGSSVMVDPGARQQLAYNIGKMLGDLKPIEAAKAAVTKYPVETATALIPAGAGTGAATEAAKEAMPISWRALAHSLVGGGKEMTHLPTRYQKVLGHILRDYYRGTVPEMEARTLANQETEILQSSGAVSNLIEKKVVAPNEPLSVMSYNRSYRPMSPTTDPDAPGLLPKSKTQDIARTLGQFYIRQTPNGPEIVDWYAFPHLKESVNTVPEWARVIAKLAAAKNQSFLDEALSPQGIQQFLATTKLTTPFPIRWKIPPK